MENTQRKIIQTVLSYLIIIQSSVNFLSSLNWYHFYLIAYLIPFISSRFQLYEIPDYCRIIFIFSLPSSLPLPPSLSLSLSPILYLIILHHIFSWLQFLSAGAMTLNMTAFYMEDVFNVSVSAMKGSADAKQITIGAATPLDLIMLDLIILDLIMLGLIMLDAKLCLTLNFKSHSELELL